MQKQIKTSLGGVYVHLEITDCTFPFCLQDFPLSHRGLIHLVMGHTSDSYTGNCDVQMWSVPAPQERSCLGHMGDFSQRILLDCQKCTIAKKSQYKLLLFWQCYHIVVLQAKQENTDAYVSSVKVFLDREALGHGDKALHC